jgi:hypothetical protein
MRRSDWWLAALLVAASRASYQQLGFTPAISIDVWELERRRDAQA